jgi:hypothetical protein
MHRIARMGTGLVLLALAACSDAPLTPPAPPAQATLVPRADGLSCTETDARLSSGALYEVCFNPANWNRDIVVFIPGYHDPASAPTLPEDLTQSPTAFVFTQLGYAFASTSFRGTGLIQPETWIGGDLLELVGTAKTLLQNTTGKTTRFVYQTGGSQGGLGTVLAVERYPNVFSGGLAACGPIGDYRRQIAYVGDFRTVYDYFFAGIPPTWPAWTQDLAAGDTGYIDPNTWDAAQQASQAALADPANAGRIAQVLSVTHAPIDPNDPATIGGTTLGLLWYSFRGTNDAILKLGGMPFTNLGRSYTGSLDDAALNAGVARFQSTADPAKIATLQTSGRLTRPLVTIHTTGDPIVPIWHEALYRNKLSFFGKLLDTPITVSRYGHCNFTDAEVLAAFAVLVVKVTGINLVATSKVLPDAHAQAEFLRLSTQYGARPTVVP